MPYNVTVDDISPLITYKGQWTDSYNSKTDPNTDRYQGRTFHSSYTDGSQASITFNGTAIYIFGAKRGDHGHYIVTVDNDQSQRFDGYAPEANGVDGVYQVPLFAKTDLKDGLHTVVLTNDPGTDTSKLSVDIDFITWTSNDPAPSKKLTIDDSRWNYSDVSQWGTDSIYVGDYFDRTEHLTNVGGAKASVTFEGNAVYFYAGTLDDHGMFSVQIDDHNSVPLNGSTNGYHSRVLMYYADGLGPGMHDLTVINTDGGKFLDVDYIEVWQSSASEALRSNTGGKSKAPVIAGAICGVVIGLAWIIGLVWWLMRKRRRNSEPVDLIGVEAKPYDVPPAGYVTGRGLEWSTQQPAHVTPYPQTQSQFVATVTERVPPLNRKGLPPRVQPINTRRNMSEEELTSSRMHVPERPQDWGPVSATSSSESTEMMLPPNYRQATEPFPDRRLQS